MLIALHGRLQAGKDTAFERIRLMNSDAQRLAFADPLKASAAAALDVTLEELEWMKLSAMNSITVRVPLSGNPDDYRFRTVSLTGRDYLQRYGTQSHRDVFGDGFWVDQALSQVADHTDSLYVITDCRFPNEAEAVSARGGLVIQVVGPEGDAAGGHASEQALDPQLIDFVVDNSVRDDNFESLDFQLNLILGAYGYVA